MAVPLQVKQFADLVMEHLIKHQIKPKQEVYFGQNGKYFPATLTLNIVPEEGNGTRQECTTDAQTGETTCVDVADYVHGYTIEFTLNYGNKTYAGKKKMMDMGTNEALHEVV